jgi:hypothetical protein
MQRSEREGKQVERPHAEWSHRVFVTSNVMQTSERKGRQVERPHAEWPHHVYVTTCGMQQVDARSITETWTHAECVPVKSLELLFSTCSLAQSLLHRDCIWIHLLDETHGGEQASTEGMHTSRWHVGRVGTIHMNFDFRNTSSDHQCKRRQRNVR